MLEAPALTGATSQSWRPTRCHGPARAPSARAVARPSRGCPTRRRRGEPGGRAETARRLEEAHKLLDEVSNMLGDVRRELLGRR